MTNTIGSWSTATGYVIAPIVDLRVRCVRSRSINTVVRGGDKTPKAILSDWCSLGLFDIFWMYHNRIIALKIFLACCLCFLMLWKAEHCLISLIFSGKRASLKRIGRTRVCHVVCYHSFSKYKKILRFYSFLSIGTILSSPPFISWPLCITLIFNWKGFKMTFRRDFVFRKSQLMWEF